MEAPATADALIKEVSSLITTRMPAGALPADLERLVREVVTARLQPPQGRPVAPAPEAASRRGATPEGVRLIDGQRLIDDGGTPLPVDEKMLVADAIGDAADDRLAGGYMVWEKAAFHRQVEAPEIAVVLEGEVAFKVGESTLTGKQGDMIYLPRGTAVEYRADSKVKLACINCI
jgi:ethanolamine utilization protein EutQ